MLKSNQKIKIQEEGKTIWWELMSSYQIWTNLWKLFYSGTSFVVHQAEHVILDSFFILSSLDGTFPKQILSYSVEIP